MSLPSIPDERAPKNAKEAKKLSLDVWRYLKDHPGLREKSELPRDIYNQVRGCRCECPLCSLFQKGLWPCYGCPLRSCTIVGSPFDRWANAEEYDDETRREAATEIYNTIREWDV